MNSRLAGATIVLAVAIGAVTACAPTPEASEPAPAFTSEAEAFAAAEETYRAYVDALNAVDLSDPETFEDVFAWTTGDANAGARESFSQMHADGWTVAGISIVTSTKPVEDSFGTSRGPSIIACLDVSDVTLVDKEGQSVVDSNRPDVQEMRIDTVPSHGSSTSLLIARLDGSDEGVCS